VKARSQAPTPEKVGIGGDHAVNECVEFVVKRLRYLGNDLKGQELEDFRSHSEACDNCRAHLKAEKAIPKLCIDLALGYSAPVALRDRVGPEPFSS
jgi:hypothetical protein